MLKLDLRIPFDYKKEELDRHIAMIWYELDKIKTNSTLAVDQDLIQNYEFNLLYFNLIVNDIEEKNDIQRSDLEKDKTKNIDAITEEYNKKPDVVKSTGETKPLSEESIKRQLKQKYVEEDNQYNVNKAKITRRNKDIKAYTRRGDKMWWILIQRNVDDKRNREQGLIQ
jgi:hypothetical protein